jgi:hypothetical protein
MNDDRMDDLLREGVRDYNEPGPVPREEMWSRIQAARTERATLPIARTSRASSRLWVWPSVGVAAALLVTAGIIIGRRMERSASGPTPVASQTTASAAQRPNAQDSAASPAERVAAVDSGARGTQLLDSTRKMESKLRDATQETARQARELASSTSSVGSMGSRSGNYAGVTQGNGPNLAYRLVVLQHLAGTEAMITSFRATAERGQTDTLIASWSRELLGTTRMLAASPAADDPVMKRLLQDLDLVITEIVQYSAHGVNNPEELKLIEQTINERSVIPKLRGTIPGRVSSAGT